MRFFSLLLVSTLALGCSKKEATENKAPATAPKVVEAGAAANELSAATMDMEKVCNAEKLSGGDKVSDPSEKATHIAKWIMTNVKSDPVIKGFKALAGAEASHRGELLLELAKENGYTGPCPMAEEKSDAKPADAAKAGPSAEAKDVENLCFAHERSGASKASKAERPMKLMRFLQDNLKTDKVKTWFAGYAEIGSPADRTASLDALIAESGYKGPCPMAEGE